MFSSGEATRFINEMIKNLKMSDLRGENVEQVISLIQGASNGSRKCLEKFWHKFSMFFKLLPFKTSMHTSNTIPTLLLCSRTWLTMVNNHLMICWILIPFYTLWRANIFLLSAVVNGLVPKQKAKHQCLLQIIVPSQRVDLPLLEQMLLVEPDPAKLFVGTVAQYGTLILNAPNLMIKLRLLMLKPRFGPRNNNPMALAMHLAMLLVSVLLCLPLANGIILLIPKVISALLMANMCSIVVIYATGCLIISTLPIRHLFNSTNHKLMSPPKLSQLKVLPPLLPLSLIKNSSGCCQHFNRKCFKTTLSRLLAVALRMYLTLHLLLSAQSM